MCILRFVFYDLYVINCCFPTCVSRLRLPNILRFIFSYLYSHDLLLPMYIFRPVFGLTICICRFVLVRTVFSVWNFPSCIFPIIFSNFAGVSVRLKNEVRSRTPDPRSRDIMSHLAWTNRWWYEDAAPTRKRDTPQGATCPTSSKTKKKMSAMAGPLCT